MFANRDLIFSEIILCAETMWWRLHRFECFFLFVSFLLFTTFAFRDLTFWMWTFSNLYEYLRMKLRTFFRRNYARWFFASVVDPEWFISDPIPDPDPTFQRVPDPIPDPDPDPTPDPDPVWIHTHTHKYLHTYTHIYTQTHKHTQTQTHIHIHTHIHTTIYM